MVAELPMVLVEPSAGRSVWITESRWQGHIIERHPEMADYLEEVCSTITDPGMIWYADLPERELFYRLVRSGKYANTWIRCVIDFRGSRGLDGALPAELKTAHVMTNLPIRRGGGLKWMAPRLL